MRENDKSTQNRAANYVSLCTHLINVPQLINERGGVRIAGISSRRWHHRYRELRIVSLSVRTDIYHGFRVSEIIIRKKKKKIIYKKYFLDHCSRNKTFEM